MLAAADACVHVAPFGCRVTHPKAFPLDSWTPPPPPRLVVWGFAVVVGVTNPPVHHERQGVESLALGNVGKQGKRTRLMMDDEESLSFRGQHASSWLWGGHGD